MGHAWVVLGWERGGRSIKNVLGLTKLFIIPVLRRLLKGSMEMMFNTFRYSIQHVSIDSSIGCAIWLERISKGGMTQGLWMVRLRL